MPLQISLGSEVGKNLLLLPVPLNVVTPPPVPVDVVGVAVTIGPVLEPAGEDISLFVDVIDSEMPVSAAPVLFDTLVVRPEEVVSLADLVVSSTNSELVEPVASPLLLLLEIELSDAVDCSTPEVELLCLEDVPLLLTVEGKAEVSSDLDMLVDK